MRDGVAPGIPVEVHLGLVGTIARAVSRGLPPVVEFDELMNDGVIGLIEASRRFDPTRGVGFSTYAGHRIRGAMLDGLRARDPLPRSLRRAQKAAMVSGASHGGQRVGRIQWLSLEDIEILPGDHAADPEDRALEADLRHSVRRSLAALSRRDREVLELRYVHGVSLRVVASRLGLSVTRVIEIQVRALTRLRRLVMGEPLCAFVKRRPRAASTRASTGLAQSDGTGDGDRQEGRARGENGPSASTDLIKARTEPPATAAEESPP